MSIKRIHIETNILQHLKEGDVNAFEHVFHLFYHQVHAFVMDTLFDKNFAEDITQSVFIALWEHKNEIDTEKNIVNYLFTIAKNKVYRQTERLILKSKHEQYLKDSVLNSLDIEEEIDSRFLKKVIFDLVEELPQSRKEIFLLSRKYQLSNKEIAKRLNISEKTVGTQIHRSVLFLKERLKFYYYIFL